MEISPSPKRIYLSGEPVGGPLSIRTPRPPIQSGMERLMENWLEGIRRILMRVPTGALAYSRILEELAVEGMGESPEPMWLLKTISERKDIFRVIPFARGPWACWREAWPQADSPSRGAPLRDDPWILLLRPPEAGFGSAESLMGRMREGLLAWGRTVDDASPASVARWIRASREGARAWEAMVSGKAPIG